MQHLRQSDTAVEYEPTSTEHRPVPTSFLSEFIAALLNTKPNPDVILPRTRPTFNEHIRYLARLWTVGIVLMTAATWGMVRLQIFDRPGTAILAYLLIIIVLSLMDSFVTSALFSLIAVGCLNYFFMVPLYSFEITSTQDAVALVAFVVTSFAITTLVRRARRFGEAQHAQAHLLDLTPDAILVVDVNRVITYWNRGAERLFGWTREEALGKTVHLLLKTVYPAPLQEIVETANRDGRWEGELVQMTRDGAEVVVSSKWTVRRDTRGNLIGTLQSNTDITARKRAEEALLKSQAAYLSEAQRLSHTGSFGWNVTTGELTWSAESFRIFGFDSEAKPTLELVFQRVHPDDRMLVRTQLERAATHEEPLDFEHRLLMPNGSVKTLHVVARPSLEERGHPKLVGAVMDVTSHKVAYSALEQSEQRYRLLFKFMPISLWRVDAGAACEMLDELRAAGVTDFPAYLDAHPEWIMKAMHAFKTEEVNDACVRLLGAKDAQDLLGPITPFWQPKYLRRLLESRFRNESFFEEKMQFVTLDGRLIDVLFTAVRTGFGFSISGLVDLTELVKAQETLERLQIEFAHAARVSTLGELTASIAHELNQPLGAIATNCSAGLRWLNRPQPDLDEVRTLIQRSLSDARRAADIIARVREMAARRAPARVLVSPHAIILEALQFLRHEVEWRGVTVSHSFLPAAPHVLADRTLLHQVIVNLAVNAMQAMAQVGAAERRITVRTASLDGASLCCSVEDSGPGIEPDHQPRLFESFFTTKEGGMGMGLSICRSIIEAHGGRIEADNGSIHGGARFSFTLPAANGTLQ
ncbi:PAS domain S-box protein [Bradyrhizobium sp. 31Argb]|uniref:PAS domain S-box protein n=1 Tax=Bradyrhizobium sp. 31Argb TaxID=3141247 RepID=UPI0037485D43